MSTAARETSMLQIGEVRPILPEQTEAAARFAREVAARDAWDCADVLAMLGVGA